MTPRLEVIGLEGLPEIFPGDDLATQILSALNRQSLTLRPDDLLIVSQKIVSKSEGRLVRLSDVAPSQAALSIARELGKDPRLIEIILRESRRVVRMDRGILIVETRHGFICANAGVDQSNVEAGSVSLLPEDPDRSAREIRERIFGATGIEAGVVISDTFGRPWREGLTNVAVGVSGCASLRSYLGEKDPAGHILHATLLATADELAGAAELVMGKLDRIPVALIRGYHSSSRAGSSRDLLRASERDLFR